jgi:hypothetical protein
MNSTAKHVPLITGLPTRTLGATAIRSRQVVAIEYQDISRVACRGNRGFLQPPPFLWLSGPLESACMARDVSNH